MSEWLKSIVGYLLIVSVTMQMLPNRKYEQYVRLFTGFVMILLVLQPVLKIGNISAFLENQILEFVQEQEMLETDMLKEREEFQKQSEQVQENWKKINVLPIERVEVILND